MGLDTSHDCWHGSYSQFMRWRQWLNLYILLDREETEPDLKEIRYKGATCEAILEAWEKDVYADQTVPLNVLMAHSDCDGEIAPEVCGPLADALEDLANRRMIARGTYDEQRPATDRFIAGLRLAASRNEAVTFG